jgi:hypothetical protein
MDMLESAFDATTYSQNRERLMRYEVAARFFAAVRDQAASKMSREHFTVDGTLIEAWASLKSFRPKDEDDDDHDNNGWGDFRGQRRSNDTHESTTDPESRLMRKGRGQPAKLSYMGHALVENRHGLLVDLQVSSASGYAERERALEMLDHADRAARSPPSALIAATIVGASSMTVALSAQHLTSHSIRLADDPRSTTAPLDTRATRSASGFGNGSSRSSVGPRPSVVSVARDTAGFAAPSSRPTSSVQPTTCFASPESASSPPQRCVAHGSR